MLVDSHCHLDFPRLVEQADDIVERAAEVGVGTLLTISTRLSRLQGALAIAERHASVWCAVGVHPHHAGEEGPPDVEALLEHRGHPKVVAFGECGLDYYYDKSPRAAQEDGFRIHIEACRQSGLPLVVHTRDADEDTLRVLEDELEKGPFEGVIHCYSSSRHLGTRAVELGFHLGIGGIFTFKRSDELRTTVAHLPRDRILLETDAPYLAPEPFRGQTNEPAYVRYVAEVLAEVWGTDVDEVARVTTGNFHRLFWRTRRA